VVSPLSGAFSSVWRPAAELSDPSLEWPDGPTAGSETFEVDAAVLKSGGGGPKSCLEVEAAYAIASAP